MTTIRVRKRDRRAEDFDRSKIEKALRRAGASAETARDVARDIEEDLRTTNTATIREKAARLLRATDERAAREFETYRRDGRTREETRRAA